MVEDREAGSPVLGRRRLPDIAPQQLADELHPVADSKNGHAQVKDPGVAAGRGLTRHARRTTGQNDPSWVHRPKLLDRCGRRLEQAECPRLPDAPRDQLGILAAEIENNNDLGLRGNPHSTGRRLRHTQRLSGKRGV